MYTSADLWSRREFLRSALVAGAASLVGIRSKQAFAEPSPEITSLRLYRFPGICIAPQYVADDMLRSEGFADVRYVSVAPGLQTYQTLAAGGYDMGIVFVANCISQIAAGLPIVILSGLHIGCFELFGTERVRSVRDLKGKRVSIPGFGGAQQLFLSTIVSYVGLDPNRDIRWELHRREEGFRLLSQGKIDAYLGFPPDPQELRGRKIGRVILNSSLDRPWSQYFCCVLAANRDFVQRYPVATKRAMRAIFKAADVCSSEPERVAKALVERGFAENYDYALSALKDIPYRRWREFDPEDTVRFYALRLHEAGLIDMVPQEVISRGTNWHSFNHLKKELKS